MKRSHPSSLSPHPSTSSTSGTSTERKTTVKRVVVFAVLLTLASLAAFAQQQPPTFGEKLDVNVVLLDVIVTDSSGHQILGLDKNDFLVKEAGAEQTVDAVDYFTNRQLLTAQEKDA